MPHAGLIDYDITLRQFQIMTYAHRLEDQSQIWWARTYRWRHGVVALEQWHGNWDASVRATTGEAVLLTIPQFWKLRLRLRWFRLRHGKHAKVPDLPVARVP